MPIRVQRNNNVTRNVTNGGCARPDNIRVRRRSGRPCRYVIHSARRTFVSAGRRADVAIYRTAVNNYYLHVSIGSTCHSAAVVVSVPVYRTGDTATRYNATGWPSACVITSMPLSLCSTRARFPAQSGNYAFYRTPSSAWWPYHFKWFFFRIPL